MIKFFRKIRRNLLSEGKTGKYLKYAIGEIILVVIGILIALQINNWNENRITKNLTKSYLLNIKGDLKADTITFGAGIKRLKITLEKQKNLLNTDFSSKIKSDSLIGYVYSAFHHSGLYQINNSTFLKMTNTGFVESNSFSQLFIDINKYYNKEYMTYSEYLKWDIESDKDVFSEEVLQEWYVKIILPDLVEGQKTEFNSSRKKESELAYRSFIESARFINYSWSNYERKRTMLERMEYQNKIAKELIKKINLKLSII